MTLQLLALVAFLDFELCVGFEDATTLPALRAGFFFDVLPFATILQNSSITQFNSYHAKPQPQLATPLKQGSPLQFCPAGSLPSSPRSEAQALRVPPAAFTSGPGLDGNQAERQICGGIFLCLIAVKLNAYEKCAVDFRLCYPKMSSFLLPIGM
jgi:hypothetical protein